MLLTRTVCRHAVAAGSSTAGTTFSGSAAIAPHLPSSTAQHIIDTMPPLLFHSGKNRRGTKPLAKKSATALAKSLTVQKRATERVPVTFALGMPPEFSPIERFAAPVPLADGEELPQIVSFAAPPIPQLLAARNSVTVLEQRRFVHASASAAAMALRNVADEGEDVVDGKCEIGHTLDASKVCTVPRIRQMLVEHAENTYAGVGKCAFDASAERSVAEGSETAVIPLASDELLRLYYMTHRRTARVGMLIEQLDMFATWIGYKHNQDPRVPMSRPAHHTIGVVTAFVDRIEVHQDQPPAYDRDIFYHGYTTWVGKSSSEVRVDVRQKFADNDIRNLMSAKFVMVALDENGKAAPNVKLALETHEELRRFREAEKAKKLRAQVKRASLATSTPTADELALLHRLHQRITDPNFTLESHRLLNEGAGGTTAGRAVLMDETAYEKSLICFPFQKNLHNKMFGGYLMRKAYEAAFANASLFARGVVPRFVFGGEIAFHKAVDIGALLWMKSQVCYTKDNYMQISVAGQMLDPSTNQLVTCNTYQYTFKVDGELPEVIPTKYSDGIRYLTAKRHFENFVEPSKQEERRASNSSDQSQRQKPAVQ